MIRRNSHGGVCLEHGMPMSAVGRFAVTVHPFMCHGYSPPPCIPNRQFAETKCVHESHQFRAVRTEPGNLCLCKAVWWHRDDSNLNCKKGLDFSGKQSVSIDAN
jgi:hypothetical protein